VIAYAAVYLFGVFISAVSQVLLKKEALKEHDNIIKEYVNPSVVFAYVLFFAATLMSIFAYKAIPLSLGPILEATSYIYVVAFGALFFKERITKKKVCALSLIIIGIVIFSFGA